MAKEKDYDPLNPEAATDEVEKAQDTKRKQEIEDLRAVVSTPSGRRFIKRLLERTAIYRSTFTGNSNGYFVEGERNIGLFIVAELSAVGRDTYPKLLLED